MKKPTLLLLALCIALLCHSQSGLYVSGSTTLSIRPNTTLAVDGLVLRPSSDYVIPGDNSVIRESTLLHPSITPAIHRSYQWAATLPEFTGSVDFYYTDAELNGLAEAELTLNVHDGTQWQAYGSSVSRDATLNVVTTFVSGLLINELSLAAEAHPLPLEWGRITATRQGEYGRIEWQTYNEQNTAYFVVERSLDGRQWHAIGLPVPARNLAGMHTYHFTDLTATDRKTYYRIQQTDIDGQATYSVIVWISALQAPASITLYPNPASQLLSIRSTAAPLHTIRLFDASGKLLSTESVPNTNIHTLLVSSLPQGVYRLQVQLADGSATHLSFIKH